MWERKGKRWGWKERERRNRWRRVKYAHTQQTKTLDGTVWFRVPELLMVTCIVNWSCLGSYPVPQGIFMLWDDSYWGSSNQQNCMSPTRTWRTRWKAVYQLYWKPGIEPRPPGLCCQGSDDWAKTTRWPSVSSLHVYIYLVKIVWYTSLKWWHLLFSLLCHNKGQKQSFGKPKRSSRNYNLVLEW